MDMNALNSAMMAEKQTQQFARMDAALAELVTMVKELKAEVADLKKPRAGKSLDELAAKYEEKTPLQKAKRLGEKTEQE